MSRHNSPHSESSNHSHGESNEHTRTASLYSIPKTSSESTFASAHDYSPYAQQSPEKRGIITAVELPIRPWTPISLRKWYAVMTLTFMLVAAAGLEVALHFSNKKQGWKVSSSFAATTGVLHYVYRLPPVAIAMFIVALWTWTDINIKKMQPYIDLAYGNAPASKTLLLDYSDRHAALVSFSAWHHNHYIVALSSLMVLSGLAMQPLTASLFTVKDTWGNAPNINITNHETLGLNPTFSNLTAFSTAAGFAQANVLYNVTAPNFVSGVWAISELEVPVDQVANGTMFADTTSVQSLGNCRAGDSGSLTPFPNGTGFTISGSSNGCSVSIPIQTTPVTQYGVDVVTCPDSPPPDPFKPVAFWTLHLPDPSSDPSYSLVYCTPSIQLLDVSATVALQTGNLLNATILGDYKEPNNLTDPNGLMQGRAMNSIAFDLADADIFVQDRAQASKNGLTGAIIQKAQQFPGGLDNQIQTFGMVNITENIYELYLSLVARNNYFVPSKSTTEVEIMTFQSRLWVVDATAHILSGFLVAFAVLGATIHILHHRMRDLVVIPRKPGTLASAAAFTARSNLSDVLDGHLDEAALARVLEHRRFGIDKRTSTIVMEGDAWYESRESLFRPGKA